MSQAVPKATKKLLRQMPGVRKLSGIRKMIQGRHRIPVYFQLLRPSAKVPDKKFMIFAQGRSGSTLLVDLLNSSPEVQCDEEILSHKVPFLKLYIKARSMKSRKPIYGFKAKIYQLTKEQDVQDPGQFLLEMHEQGWKIIYLKRTNILRHAMSNVILTHRKTLGHTKAWRHKVLEGPLELGKIHVDCKVLIKRMQEREELLQDEEKVLKSVPHITVVYEDDLLRPEYHQRTLDRLFDHLGTPRVPVATQLAKISKDKLEDVIENYEEVSQALATTKYAGLLFSE